MYLICLSKIVSILQLLYDFIKKNVYEFSCNEALAKDKSLQEKIIAWSLDMLEEARTDWNDMHKKIIGS